MTMQVLLIEKNDLHHSESLLPHLQHEGYQVAVVHSFETAAEKTRTLWPNLIIFSPSNSHLQLPHFEEMLSQVKLDIPYIVVAVKHYQTPPGQSKWVMISPDKPDQLAQGIAQVTSPQKDRFIRLPDLVVDCHHHQLLRNEKTYSLTPKEFKLLHLLLAHPNEVLSRKTIMRTVWETDYMGDTRTLDVHIRWLREKIEDKPSKPRRLITVRGVGYRFLTNIE